MWIFGKNESHAHRQTDRGKKKSAGARSSAEELSGVTTDMRACARSTTGLGALVETTSVHHTSVHQRLSRRGGARQQQMQRL